MHLNPKSLLLSTLLTTSLTAAYHVVVKDQNTQTVRIFDRNAASWNQDAIFWVVGKGLDLKLDRVKTYKLPPAEDDDYDGNLNGHDLQPSYRDDDSLLLTHTRGAFSFKKSTGEFTEIMKLTKLKSFVETDDGEYVWVRGGEGDMGQYVSFSDRADPKTVTDKRGWGDAKFYKARIYNPDYY